jgi:hypothetical protein
MRAATEAPAFDENAAWSLVSDLELAIDREGLRIPLASLSLALAEGRSELECERRSRRLTAEAWTTELAGATHDALLALSDELKRQLRWIADALDDLRRPPGESLVARAVLDRIAIELAREAQTDTRWLASLEHELRDADGTEERLRIVLQVVRGAANVLDVCDDELRAAIVRSAPRAGSGLEMNADGAARALARQLATPARRRGVRDWVDGLANALRDELPLLSRELTELAAESEATDAADDRAWTSAVVGLVARGRGIAAGSSC